MPRNPLNPPCCRSGRLCCPLLDDLHEVVRDDGVVTRGQPEDLEGQQQPRVLADIAVRLQLPDDRRVVLRIDYDHDIREVLRRRPNPGRPTDVDLLDSLRECASGLDRLPKLVEVDHHEVDRTDAILPRLLPVLLRAPLEEDPSLDLGDERLHPAFEHLRDAGVVRNLDDLHACLRNRLGRAAGREDLDLHLPESLGEFHHSGLVRNADQSSTNPFSSHDLTLLSVVASKKKNSPP